MQRRIPGAALHAIDEASRLVQEDAPEAIVFIATEFLRQDG